jgi:hypothetical protein
MSRTKQSVSGQKHSFPENEGQCSLVFHLVLTWRMCGANLNDCFVTPSSDLRNLLCVVSSLAFYNLSKIYQFILDFKYVCFH